MTAAPSGLSGSRYETLVKIASGGMATVFVGRSCVPRGSQQLVAIKRPHPHLLDDESFRRGLLAEANLASRIHHANVVSVRDVEVQDDSLHLVMDYVEGLSLVELLTTTPQVGTREELARVCLRVLLDACAGLHAAHELTDDHGRPLGLVHRDVSPHNILVGVDGISRVVDFGIAKCVHQRDGMSTVTGTVKGKIAYMAPEYVSGKPIDRRSDIFAIGILFWEVLSSERLFRGLNEAETISRVLTHRPPPISTVAPFCGTRFDTIIGRALAKEPPFRHATVLVLAEAIEAAARGSNLIASHEEVALFAQKSAGDRLTSRRSRVKAMLDRVVAEGEGDRRPPSLAKTINEQGEEEEDSDETQAGTMPLLQYDSGVLELEGMTQAQEPLFPPVAPVVPYTVPLGTQTPDPPIKPPARTAGLATARPVTTFVESSQRSASSSASAQIVPVSSPQAQPKYRRTIESMPDTLPSVHRRQKNRSLGTGLVIFGLLLGLGGAITFAVLKNGETGGAASVKATIETPPSTPTSSTSSFTSPDTSSAASAPISTSSSPSGSASSPVTTAATPRHPPRTWSPPVTVTTASPATTPTPKPATPPASPTVTSTDTPRPLPTNPYH